MFTVSVNRPFRPREREGLREIETPRSRGGNFVIWSANRMAAKRGGRGLPGRLHPWLSPTSAELALRWAKHNADQYIARSTLDDRGSPLTGRVDRKRGRGSDRGCILSAHVCPLVERHLIFEDYQRSIRQICCSPYIETATGVLLVGMAGIVSPPVVLLVGRKTAVGTCARLKAMV